MELNRDNWWQIQLRNVLGAISFFGLGLTLLRLLLREEAGPVGFLLFIGGCGSFGSAIGMLFGRTIAGLLCGFLIAGVLLLVLVVVSIALVVVTHR